MAENLKKETAKGVAWNAVERFSTSGVLFLANIILARILTPEDFGLLAVITIFIQISQTFIDSGFSNALIQKKDRNQVDYSTVFFFNLLISIIFYGILWICAPLIASFFDNEHLCILTRVVGLNLILGALVSVNKTRLSVLLHFKIQSIISLASCLTAAIISIYLAYRGIGIWALVLLTLINSLLQTILLNLFCKWSPSLIFSFKAFKSLFSYSSKLLASSLIHLLYRNIYPIVIGKKFSPTELGYFNRADTIAMYPAGIVAGVFSKVGFPIFSRLQDDNNKLRIAYSKYIVFSSIIIFPVMIGLIALAKPLTIVVLKEQWLPMVPMLQILCIDWMTDHLCQINMNILFVKGRSDLALRLEIIKKTIAILIFIISLYWGIIGVCWGRCIYGFIAVYLNSYYTKSLIDLSILRQLKDILKPLCLSLTMGAIVLVFSNIDYNLDLVVNCALSILIGIISYIGLLFIFGKSYLIELKDLRNS